MASTTTSRHAGRQFVNEVVNARDLTHLDEFADT
jgi:hypothetical protein